MMSRPVLLAATLLALAACGPAEKAGTPNAKPAAAPVEAPALVTRKTADGRVDRFTPYVGGPLALDEYSVGPLMAQTEFSLEAITPRFPKGQVKTAFLHADAGKPAPIITVEQGGGVIEIQGNPGLPLVGDIRVDGGTPIGPRGETLGMKFADADMDYERCHIGEGRDRYAVVCIQPGEAVLRYVFAVPGWTTDVLPPLDVLRQKAVLRGFIWKGGAPAV
ncbi:DUF1131 family protein [soil metagenome]